MSQLILALLVGIACGMLLKNNKALTYMPKIVLATVAALLLVMGAKIGSNPEILASLPRLGGQSLVFAVLSIAGGILLSLPLRARN